MNEHSLTVLNYHEVLEQIAEFACSNLAQGIVRRIRPVTQVADITVRRTLVQEMLTLGETTLSLPSLRLEDISDLLRKVAPDGAVVDGVDLILCLDNLGIASDLLNFITKPETEPYAELRRRIGNLSPCTTLWASLKQCLDSDGTVLDNATPRLGELRRGIISTEQRIRRLLEQMVKSPDMASTQQDKFVTMRNGRYVVPVKKDARGKVTGLIHDVSQSGQTVFIEPAVTLPLGNDLVRMRGEEREEVRRILLRLTTQVRTFSDALRRNQDIIIHLDAAHAIANWGKAFRCFLPEFGRKLSISDARHPLLMAQFRKNGHGEEVVPLSMALPDGIRVLAITGSNTGGKTIALKTVGLCCLLAQSGLPVPATAGSQFVFFDTIVADIGDEQSLEANLSTYSGHLANIGSILKDTLQGRSLVLLDELGSGTDPLEGGAIACGVLEELAKRQALTLTTTHLGMVKNYVHAHPQMLNASVRFDLDTLKPLYVLDIGRPGASHALHIAKRLGIPKAVLLKAEKMLSGEQLRLEDMLASMEKDQKNLAEQSRQAEERNAELKAKGEQLKQELEELKADRKRKVNEAYKEADAIVDNTRKEMENLLRGIREREKQLARQTAEMNQPVAQAEFDINGIHEALAEKKRKLAVGQGNTAAKAPKPMPADQLTIGKKVWVESLQAHGKVERILDKGKKVELSVKGVAFTMKVSELQHPQEPDDEPQGTTFKISLPIAQPGTSLELNLIGKRVEEALPILDAYLSRALMARMAEVRIIHGFGTGRLRIGIQEALKRHPLVKSFHQGKDYQDPGGGGATIVELKL